MKKPTTFPFQWFPNIHVRLQWKPQDLWIGAYWKRVRYGVEVWVCLLPCLPLHLTFLYRECERCGALVRKLGTEEPTGRQFCCIHCAWNPAGCLCRVGKHGEPDTQFGEDPLVE